eukprot:PhM_4_TR11364/c0_g1_i1/m.40220
MFRRIALTQRSHGGAPLSRLVTNPSRFFSTTAPLHMLPNGRTYHAPGHRLASHLMPVDDEGIEKYQALAKHAAKEKNYPDAIALHERLSDYLRQKYGSTGSEVADCLYTLARLLVETKNPARACGVIEEACALYENMDNAKGKRYAEAMSVLCAVYKDVKPFAVADKAFADTTEVMKDLYYDRRDHTWVPSTPCTLEDPAKSPLSTVAHLFADRGALHVAANQVRQAQEYFETSLEIRRYLYGSSDKYRTMVAQTLVKLAEVCRHRGNNAQADVYIDEAIQICMEVAGRDAPATAQAISTKGHIHMAKGEANLAKKCFEESVTTFGMSYGNESPLVGLELLMYGRCCQVLKEYPDAERALTRAHLTFLGAYGPDNVHVADALSHLGSLQAEMGRVNDAEKSLSTALKIRRNKTPEDASVCILLQKLGELYALEKKTEAETYLLEAIHLYKKSGEKEALVGTDAMDELGWFYCNYSLHEKAEELFKEALELRLKCLGLLHPSVGYSYSNMASVYAAQRRWEDAQESCQKAIDIYIKSHGDNWTPLADCYQNMAQIHRASEDGAERAIEWYNKAQYVRRMNNQQQSEEFAQLLFVTARTMVDAGLQLGVAERYANEALELVQRNSKNEGAMQNLYQLKADIQHQKAKAEKAAAAEAK